MSGNSAVKAVSLIAPAKVNLVLEILSKREDVYHDIDTVMTTVELADRIRLWPSDQLEIEFIGRDSNMIESDGELVAAAVQALGFASGHKPAVKIEIDKRIPVAAGLGGGSSDAAAVLRGLDHLWGLGWSMPQLEDVAATLGSDVPFFLHGGTARCRGRGELVSPLPDLRPLRMLILMPPAPQLPGKTARRFAALHTHDFSDGARSERMAHRVGRGAPPPSGDLWNAFETVIERTESELLANYAAYAGVLGGLPLHLTGTGPAVFLLTHEQAKVGELRHALEQVGAEVLPSRTLARAGASAIDIEAE